MTKQLKGQMLCFAGAMAIAGIGLSMAEAQQMPLEPHQDAGQSITGVFEGWFRNPDLTFSFEMGYYNRNLKEEVDIPAGPNNKIEPGGPDQGQPTHFMPGRAWGNFIIKAPKDFGSNKLTWTLTVNGKTTVIPLSLKTDWEVTPFIDATNNTPPVISFTGFDKGAMVQGPIPMTTFLSATVGEPVALTVYAADDNVIAPGSRVPKVPVTVTWTMFRGPGSVSFSERKPVVEKIAGTMPPKTTFAGKATTTATFSEPGEYVLEVVGNDVTGDGGGGFQCCWTNAMVKVSVSPRSISVSGGF
jgi:hypothetical protein